MRDGARVIGSCAVRYGQPAWNAAFDKFVEPDHPPRWRLGKDHWTTLDSDLTLDFAMGPTVPPGYYYLLLEKRGVDRSGNDRFGLVLLDPARVRASRLDAARAGEVRGGAFVPLRHAHVEAPAKTLQIALVPAAGARGNASLEIRFGSHVLRAAFQAVPAEPIPVLPDIGVGVSRDTQWILERAERLELLALHPEDRASGKDAFHGHKVLGRATLAGAGASRSLVDLVYRGIAAYDGVGADCFEPRHGIRARLGHLVVDLVICYRCKAILVFRSDTEDSPKSFAGTQESVKAKVGAVFTAAGLKIAK